VEPDVKQVAGVFPYDIDDLTRITQANELLRRAEVDKAMEIVDAEVSRYMAWFKTMRVKPTVSALVQKAEAIRRAQLETALKRLPNLSQDERESLDAMTRAIVKRVLHDPVRCLKRECQECHGRSCYDNEVHVQAVSEMFRLGNGVSG
jgi:glutamyl-tRNA reductase